MVFYVYSAFILSLCSRPDGLVPGFVSFLLVLQGVVAWETAYKWQMYVFILRGFFFYLSFHEFIFYFSLILSGSNS
jgi:hypothetical protein